MSEIIDVALLFVWYLPILVLWATLARGFVKWLTEWEDV